MATTTRTRWRSSRTTDRSQFPEFEPHRLLKNPHAQTLAGVYLPSSEPGYCAIPHRVQLSDGDQLVLHDDRPDNWSAGSRVVLLVHGLGGCHQSGYMRRIAWKLNGRGLRTLRMDMRGFGAGFGLARLPFHGGRSADLAAAAEFIAGLCPGSAVTLVGFSLGAGMIIKLLGELAGEPGHAQRIAAVDSAVAVCPPLDLDCCSRKMSESANRIYQRHFLALLIAQLRRHRRARPDCELAALVRRPRSVYEFDDLFTGPACGFGSAENYYLQASAGRFLPQVKLPLLVLRAADDPLVDQVDPRQLALPACVQWETTVGGGHLGFIAPRGLLPDRRWMDWRVVEWVTRLDRAGLSAMAPGASLAEHVLRIAAQLLIHVARHRGQHGLWVGADRARAARRLPEPHSRTRPLGPIHGRSGRNERHQQQQTLHHRKLPALAAHQAHGPRSVGLLYWKRLPPLSQLHDTHPQRSMQPDQNLSSDETGWLAEAARYLEKPSLLMRLAGVVGRPLEVIASLLDRIAPDLVASTVSTALGRALTLAVYTLPESSRTEPVASSAELRQLGTSTSFWHNLSVAATGLPSGFFGIAGLPIELPITTTIMLRSIAAIAREFGEDLGEPEVRLQCLAVLGLGSPSQPGQPLESSYLTARIGVQEAVAKAAQVAAKATTQELLDMINRGSAPALLNLIAKIAARFNVTVTEKLMAQSVPVIGAVSAAALNVAFLEHFNQVARYHFGMRRLERKYGLEIVQSAYRQQARVASGA